MKPGVSSFRYGIDISNRNYRKQPKCNVEVVMKWKKELQSSCVSTPVAYSFLENGSDEVLANRAHACVDCPQRVLEVRGCGADGWIVVGGVALLFRRLHLQWLAHPPRCGLGRHRGHCKRGQGRRHSRYACPLLHSAVTPS